MGTRNTVIQMKGGRVKIGDLGMARIVSDNVFSNKEGTVGAREHQRMTGMFGTQMYMAPEMTIVGKQYSPFAADIYSAGVVLFLMATGTHPYENPWKKDDRFSTIWGHGKRGIEHLLRA